MKTAIITGASAGLGRELALSAARAFEDIECFWLIARREEYLRALSSALPGKRVRLLALDLCSRDSFSVLSRALEEEKPEAALLINNAGCGYLGNVGEGALERQVRMTDLNVTALTAVTHLVLPYMPSGGRIINISSIASFCPNPRMTVYSAGKAYASAFSRALGDELRPRSISVTAVCPGPMDTDFINSGGIKGNSRTFDILPYCEAKRVAAEAVEASKKRRAVCTPRAFYKFYRVLAKALPQRLMIKFTRT